ncbi:MAG: hypothetical protein NTV88_03320 [Candidatus Micrarchaeota archaeon]|nr:hypothetical protein [Candidatus Micrarchaeota archaeon]
MPRCSPCHAYCQSDLFDKEQQLNKTRVSLEEQQAKVAAISTDLFSLETNINASMAWFKVNAQLPTANIHLLDIFKTRMISDCVDGSELNLACISYLMANTAFNIHYRTDPQSTGKADFLQSVEQTIESQWGDCEDYSLLFKAELNYARQAQHGLSIVTFAGGGNGDFRVYPKESIPLSGSDSYWYVPNAHKIQLGSLDSINAYVICFRADSQNGHCTVALSQNRIENSGQIQLLAGAQVFESQTGQYLGTVGNEYTVCSSNDCLYQARAIMLVISDSDLYKFENGEWTSYSDYLARVNAARQELSAPNGA